METIVSRKRSIDVATSSDSTPTTTAVSPATAASDHKKPTPAPSTGPPKADTGSRYLRGARKGVRLKCFFASSKGKKRYMEDRTVVCNHVDLAPIVKGLGIKTRFAYFGVYDGHGGSSTVDYVQTVLAKHIFKRVSKLQPKFAKDEMKQAIMHGHDDADVDDARANGC